MNPGGSLTGREDVEADIEFIRQGPSGKERQEFIEFGDSLSPDIGPMFGRDAARVGRYAARLEACVAERDGWIEVVCAEYGIALPSWLKRSEP
jgi:hypothetical protein